MELHGPEDLCLIDSGIVNLKDVPLTKRLQRLNLHSNCIERIEHLTKAPALTHLDLSSNSISKMDGLSALVHLKVLNLSSNRISVVSGLDGLVSLVHLNLSYNEIVNVEGLSKIQGSRFALKHLRLHGNERLTVDSVCRCLHNCKTLSTLTLFRQSVDDVGPLRHQTPAYVVNVFVSLPNLTNVDGYDAFGQYVSLQNESAADILELEDYAAFVENSTASQSAEIFTPRIDAALNTFRQQKLSQTDAASSRNENGKKSSTPNRPLRRPVSANAGGMSSEESAGERSDRSSQMKNSCSVKSSSSLVMTDVPHDEPECLTSKRDAVRTSSNRGVDRGSTIPESDRNEKSRRRQLYSSAVHKARTNASKQLEYAHLIDKKKRDDVHAMYLQLMKDLEIERDCRLRAEEIAKHLSEQLDATLQKAKPENSQQLQRSADELKQLKQELVAERDLKQQAKAEIESMQSKIDELEKKTTQYEQNIEELSKKVDEYRSTVKKNEVRYSRHAEKISQQLQNAELKCAMTARELELVTLDSKNAKDKVSQLQALLAEREQAHQQELLNRQPLSSQEIDDIIHKALAKAEGDRKDKEQMQLASYNSLQKKYDELEEEFRMALRIENSRFSSLQEAYEKCCAEAASNRAALEAAYQRDSKSTTVINELTALVREQKGRIIELSRGKTEQVSAQQERIRELEMHLDEARRRMIQLEMLKKENVKLQAALHSQESLVSGLREERKVWSEELAQQGVRLTQDRGRLETRIETLQLELDTMRKNLDSAMDAVRIKTKLVDDQTETIRKLKDAVVERDETVKQAREELIRVQRDLEEQLAGEVAENTSLLEQLSHQKQRREELKGELNSLQSQLTKEKQLRASLEEHWKSKADKISAVEQQVVKAKSAWEEKERKLREEKDQAVEAAAASEKRLREIDDAFRQQLARIEQSHRTQIDELTVKMQTEIDTAVKRKADVEDEMRILLHQTEIHRQSMNERLEKLTVVFKDLRQDLNPI